MQTICWAGMIWVGLFGGRLNAAQIDEAAVSSNASTQAVIVRQASEVVNIWKPHQHLFVKGNIGVGISQLNALETWLDVNGSNWTIVLMESASGERYTDNTGASYSGMDAVEHGLGKGLFNMSGFGDIVHPRTKEPCSAMFILFLQERKFSYYASAAMDKRGLGEDHWQNRLDAPAKEAMRNGGRIIDAAKNTVSSINSQLEQSITNEINARERRIAAEKADREREAARAQSLIKNAGIALSILEEQIEGLRQQRPGAAGDLVRPDIPTLHANLKSAQNEMEKGNSVPAANLASMVKQQSDSIIRSIEDYRKARPLLEDAEKNLSQLERHLHAGSAAKPLGDARAALKQAVAEYDRASSGYAASLRQAQEMQAAAANDLMAAQERAYVKQQFIWMSSLVSLLAFSVVAVFLNRRRRPMKIEAHQLCESWEKALSEKNSALFELLDTVGLYIGLTIEEAAERFQGDTKQLTEQIIQDVDELLIMSSCAGRVLLGAQGMVKSATMWGQLYNGFSRKNYGAAIHRLRDEPIQFTPGDAIELVVKGPKTTRDRLMGHLESYQPFAMSFNQLIEAFNERAARALVALDTVESSLKSVENSLSQIDSLLNKVQAAEANITQASQEDQLWDLAPVWKNLLPQSRAALLQARKNAVSDPVGALKRDGAKARQIAEDANALIGHVGNFRKEPLSNIRLSARELGRLKYDSQWIEDGLIEFSERANHVASRSLEGSVSESLSQFHDEFLSFAAAVQTACSLAEKDRPAAAEAIQKSEDLIQTTRDELSRCLDLDASKILVEISNNPSDCIAYAREQFQAAGASINRGDVAAVRGALAEVNQAVERAQAIVASTRSAFDAHLQTVENMQAEQSRITALIPERQTLLAEMHNGYAPAVMLLGEGDPNHPNANGSIQDNLEETTQHLSDAKSLLLNAESAFQNARILESANLLEQVKACLDLSFDRLQEIQEKRQRLTLVENENIQKLLEMDQQARQMESSIYDPRTLAQTMNLFTQATQALAQARHDLEMTPKDPFRTERSLAAIASQLDALQKQIERDWSIYAEAERSLKAATQRMQEARRIAEQTLTDRIGDSLQIVQAREKLVGHAARLDAAWEVLKQPHGDWPSLDVEADQIEAETARLITIIRGQIQEAEAVTSAITLAAAAVRAAASWSGHYYTGFFGNAGRDALNRAHTALEQGLYPEALRAAELARQAANRAIAEAEAEERRLRREEEERQERERRRRREEEARRHSMLSSSRSSFHHGSGSSRSSFSSGSGASRSSFSSGSGFKRSGW